MSELRAGVAEIDITPPIGHRMAGHFYEVLSEGTYDPLKAKALVMQQGEHKIALAFADVISISPNISRHVRQRYSRIGNIPMNNVVISATHSHAGPLYDDVRRDYFHDKAVASLGHDPNETVNYPDFLADRLVEVLSLADGQLNEAELVLASIKNPRISFNRRYFMKDGTVRFNPGQLNPDIMRVAGPIDPNIDSLVVRPNGSKRAIGSLTVFACHPDTLGGTQYSADYPFFIEQQLRRRFGADFISVFGNGTSGDINHIDVTKETPRKDEGAARRLGGAIGDSVLLALDSAKHLTEPCLDSRSIVLDIPLQEVSADMLNQARKDLSLLNGYKNADEFTRVVDAIKALELEQRGTSWPVEVQAFRFDRNTAMISLPGEIFAALGLDIKKQSPFTDTIVTTLANDRLSYIPTEQAFEQGSYEVTNSRVKPGSGEKLVEASLDLLEELAI